MVLSHRYSRRAILRFAGLAATGAASGVILAACSSSAPASAPTSAPTTAASAAPTAAATSASASASTPSAAATSAPAASAATQLVFLCNSGGNPQKMYSPIFDNFQKANPGLTVQPNFSGASAAEEQTKLLLMISGGTPPDVYWIHTYTNAGVSALGIPEDLNNYVKADKTFSADNFYPASIADFAFQSKQNALPRETTSTILIYNQDLFQKANLSLPTADWKWADYEQAAQKLTSGTGPNKVWGTAGWIQPGYAYYSFIRDWQEGGDVLNADRTQYTLDDDFGVKTYTWVNNLVKQGWHPSSAQGAANDPATLFQSGKIGMIPTFNVYPFFANAKFSWDIQHLPHDGKQVTRTASAGHAMASAGKSKDSAWKLLSYLEGKDSMQALFDFGLPVAFKTIAEEAVKNQSGKPPAHIQIGLDAMSYARPEPVAGDWIGVHQTIASALESVYGPEQKAVKDALTGIASKVNSLIAAKPTAGG